MKSKYKNLIGTTNRRVPPTAKAVFGIFAVWISLISVAIAYGY